MAEQINEIRAILNNIKNDLINKPNVVATGIGYKMVKGRQTGQLSIICSVEVKVSPELLRDEELIPTQVRGIATDVIATGAFTVHQEPTGRFRPAPGGVSLGHVNITAGTLGCLVQKDGTLYILSNNHVLANSNAASIGDAVLQPGPYDGGTYPDDAIAQLSDFVPISFNGGPNGKNKNHVASAQCPTATFVANFLNTFASMAGSKTRLRPYRIGVAKTENKVDCAIAKPADPGKVTKDILQIGAISDVGEAELGMGIKKSGRTTGLTTGSIQQVDVTVRVNYGANKVATFTDQVLAGGMSQGGDSGSAVLDSDNNLVGLLFAGSTNSTIINRIQNVFDALNVTLP